MIEGMSIGDWIKLIALCLFAVGALVTYVIMAVTVYWMKDNVPRLRNDVKEIRKEVAEHQRHVTKELEALRGQFNGWHERKKAST